MQISTFASLILAHTVHYIILYCTDIRMSQRLWH